MSDKPDAIDPDAPSSAEELAEAAKLRDALAGSVPAHGEAELARALSAAWSPLDLGPGDHRALVDEALARHALRRRRARAVARASFGAGAVVALAAGVALVVGNVAGSPRTARTATVALVSTRSTQALFSEPFAREGGQTARVDRIAMARAADLRENEFARWGVR
jgi:hypothetical protein